MRARIHAVIAAAVLAVTLTGCSSSDGEVTTKPKTATPADAATSSEPASETPKQEDAAIGDTISLTGMEGGKLDVTAVKVVDPATSSVEGFAPEDGNRWIGVQFRLVNTGNKAYSDSPINGAQIADSEGQQFQPTFADITAGPSMSSNVNLKPGSKALGWIVFDVPKASKADTVQFAMDSGFADQVGEWKLP